MARTILSKADKMSSAGTVVAGAADSREFRYQHTDFQRARKLIYARAGITLGDSKQDMVYSRLSRRLRQLGLDSVQDYLDHLERSGEDEWQQFVNALTTNLTAFFREPHHFEMLAEHLQRVGQQPRLAIWCSAASTGEEPYSIAMTVAEHYGSLQPPVRILATDIDTQVLQTAERGVYPLERLEKVSPERVRRFFQKGCGALEGQCRVIEDLRRMITFRPLNLLHRHWPMRGPFTAIFCRNVMIYFDRPTQQDLVRRMAPLLSRDALFFAGHSESLGHCADTMRPVGRTVYRLRGDQ